MDICFYLLFFFHILLFKLNLNLYEKNYFILLNIIKKRSLFTFVSFKRIFITFITNNIFFMLIPLKLLI